MEKLNILDILLTYKNDSDKIAILGKAMEMMLDYTDKIEAALKTLNQNIHTIAKAVTTLNGDVQRMSQDMDVLKSTVILDISRLEESVGIVKESVNSVKVRAVAQISTPASADVSHRTSIVEESLMKPSQIGQSFEASTGDASPLGGGMSIRSAMMAEIKQRLHGQDQAVPSASKAPQGEMGGGYVPKIHQPREAKSLEGGLVSKMNKLLDSKFQKMTGGGGPPGAPPSARGPPSAPPSARAPPSAFMPPSKDDKKKDKKDKKKDKLDSRLSSIEQKIRDKLG